MLIKFIGEKKEMDEFFKDDKRKEILKDNDNLLIMGGPGSGKTTIALFKAQQIVKDNTLKCGQKILFLSFARATISRVEEQTKNLISADEKKHIEINTYHGFIWNILKQHGYLLTNKPIKLLPPHETAEYLIDIDKSKIINTLENLFYNKGLIHFDLFAPLCTQLLSQSKAIRKIISLLYPIIILDEFQDTNTEEWNLINILGENSRLIALADPEQRIYDFRGADPKRITQYIEKLHPSIYNFGTENNRSNGTDIVQFGNDLLSKTNKGKDYSNVKIKKYQYLKKPLAHFYLKMQLLSIRNRLIDSGIKDWSIAILVPTNSLMLEVSDFLIKEQKLQNGKTLCSIKHNVSIETSGVSLSALLIAYLLESASLNKCNLKAILELMIKYILGRKGTKPITQEDKKIIEGIEKYIKIGKAIGNKRKALVSDCKNVIEILNQIKFSGNIIKDWKIIVNIIDKCHSEYFMKISKDIKYIRLLRKGNQLYTSLDKLWRNTNSYSGAFDAVSSALTQEHFDMSTKTWSGVNVMTIHKAKGKEFDEVIIYEGLYQNKIVSKPDRINQGRLNLRVAVTRAKNNATILTPFDDPCILLF